MDDWESVDSEPLSNMEAEPPMHVEQAGQKKLRVQLPSGNTLDLCEVTVPSQASEAPATDGRAATDSSTLWRTINKNRRWNSTIQMLQNKLRQEKRPANALRDAFVVAAEDVVFPGRVSQKVLASKVADLGAACQSTACWTWLGPVVTRLEQPEAPSKTMHQVASPDSEALEQAKTILLFALCCVFNPIGDDAHIQDGIEPVVEAVPASFQIAVTGHTTVEFGASLMTKVLGNHTDCLLSSIAVDMDFTAANRTRAVLQTRAKQSAREQQLYGRSQGTPVAPAPPLVPCTVTLKGPNYVALQRICDKVAEELRMEVTKRQRNAEEDAGSKRRARAAPCGGAGQDRPTRLATALASSLLADR